jgi:hypothetical protein
MGERRNVRALAQVLAVEQRDELRAFVSLDDLERLAAEDPSDLPKVFGQLRTVYESFRERPGVIYTIKEQE